MHDFLKKKGESREPNYLTMAILWHAWLVCWRWHALLVCWRAKGYPK
mgnify:CR=1 FL=1